MHGCVVCYVSLKNRGFLRDFYKRKSLLDLLKYFLLVHYHFFISIEITFYAAAKQTISKLGSIKKSTSYLIISILS